MTLEQLNYLIVLAEEQNVTRAAQRLYITQPTLTTFITKLERELGTKLFDRTRTPVRTTKNGELYIKKMKELLLAEQQLKEELKYYSSEHRLIRIGIGYAHSVMWSARLAQELLSVYPKLNIRFCEGQEAKMISDLREGVIDLFFGHAEIDSVNLTFGELFQERILLLLPKGILTSASEIPTPDNPMLTDVELLSNMKMIIQGNSMGLNLNVQLLWKYYNITPTSVIQTNNMVAGIQMVSKGLGYMLGNEELTQFLPPDEQLNIIYCSLPKMKHTRKYFYGYLADNPEHDVILKTIEIMRNIINGE